MRLLRGLSLTALLTGIAMLAPVHPGLAPAALGATAGRLPILRRAVSHGRGEPRAR